MRFKFLVGLVAVLSLISFQAAFSEERNPQNLSASGRQLTPQVIEAPCDRFTYFKIGIPEVGFGIRSQGVDNMGWDISCAFASLFLLISRLEGKAIYLFHYPKGDSRSYLGVGPGVSVFAAVGCCGGGDVSPGVSIEGLIGYEWKKRTREGLTNERRFIQLEPGCSFLADGSIIPTLALTWGFGF